MKNKLKYIKVSKEYDNIDNYLFNSTAQSNIWFKFRITRLLFELSAINLENYEIIK